MDGKKINEQSQQILHQLAEMWGGTQEEVLYYGSVDATLLYVRLIGRYCHNFGKSLLDESVIWRNKQEVTMADSARQAVAWIEKRIAQSDLGLVEFCRTNPYGHSYQVWKDGSTSYLHLDGSRANFSRPIASIEVQGLAYDALMEASWLFSDDLESVKRWQQLAKHIQQAVITQFWMPDYHYFAEALDRGRDGAVRQVQTLTSNPAELLDTALFDTLPAKERYKFVGAIVGMVYSDEFLTDVGVRCRALRHIDLIDFADYHGSWAVWAKATYDIAKGLRRQGFGKLAEQLEQRILNATRLSGWHYEFWYVDESGRVDYDPKQLRPMKVACREIVSTHVPEDIQAWTVSAVLAITQDQARQTQTKNTDWAQELGDRLLMQQPRILAVANEQEALNAYPEDYCFVVNLEEGYKRRLTLVEKQFISD
jgi:glycogen debranching enzyme